MLVSTIPGCARRDGAPVCARVPPRTRFPPRRQTLPAAWYRAGTLSGRVSRSPSRVRLISTRLVFDQVLSHARASGLAPARIERLAACMRLPGSRRWHCDRSSDPTSSKTPCVSVPGREREWRLYVDDMIGFAERDPGDSVRGCGGHEMSSSIDWSACDAVEQHASRVSGACRNHRRSPSSRFRRGRSKGKFRCRGAACPDRAPGPTAEWAIREAAVPSEFDDSALTARGTWP